MCTSIVVNKNKTIVGWNLDILDMEWRVRNDDEGVYIEINDAKEGWMPLFGANCRGDFVGMPTCWPFDSRSNPIADEVNIINLDIDLLLQKKSLQEIRKYVENNPVCSVSGLTFMGALSDKNGNVLHVIPGQGFIYYEKPEYRILTNFSPFKNDTEMHPWMGLDRYQKAEEMLKDAKDGFDVEDCFAILKAVSQEVCPTEVSMVFDVDERTVYWCEKRNWDNIHKIMLKDDTNKNIGYCGIDCSRCDAYIATKNNDQKLFEKTAQLWSELNHAKITPDQLICEGCRYDGAKSFFCGQLCEIRKCAAKKEYFTCAECSKMEECETLKMITGDNQEAYKNLQELKNR